MFIHTHNLGARTRLTARQNPASCKTSLQDFKILLPPTSCSKNRNQSSQTESLALSPSSHRQLWEKVPGHSTTGRTRKRAAIEATIQRLTGSFQPPSLPQPLAPSALLFSAPVAYVWRACADEDTSLRLRGVRRSSAAASESGGGARFVVMRLRGQGGLTGWMRLLFSSRSIDMRLPVFLPPRESG